MSYCNAAKDMQLYSDIRGQSAQNLVHYCTKFVVHDTPRFFVSFGTQCRYACVFEDLMSAVLYQQ